MIEGGKVFTVALVVLVVFGAVAVYMALSTYSVNDYLTASAPKDEVENINQEGRVAGDVVEESVDLVEPEVMMGNAELLGMVDYPVVQLPDPIESIFSPAFKDSRLVLSEAQIAQRCSHMSMPFNKRFCLEAETKCADAISSNSEHWDCLIRLGRYGAPALR